jgi:hypothetical protein
MGVRSRSRRSVPATRHPSPMAHGPEARAHGQLTTGEREEAGSFESAARLGARRAARFSGAVIAYSEPVVTQTAAATRGQMRAVWPATSTSSAPSGLRLVMLTTAPGKSVAW